MICVIHSSKELLEHFTKKEEANQARQDARDKVEEIQISALRKW
jgi:hypothetical protein